MRRWPQTHGELEKHEVALFDTSSRPPSERNYKVEAKYHYEVDGREYTSTRVSPWDVVASHNLRALLRVQLRGVDFDESGKVLVYFNPRRPSKSVLILPGRGGMLFTAAVGLLPFFLFYLTR
jgi:hypothetical protein